jgi:hypothetical protein
MSSVTSTNSSNSYTSSDTSFAKLRDLLSARRANEGQQQKSQQVKKGDDYVQYTADDNKTKKITLPKLAAKVARNSEDLNLTYKLINSLIQEIIKCIREGLPN